jgi:xylulose-5-phosphate/fructose-6-phosphate phosphoketolase
LARIPRDELEALFRGYGYTPYVVEGDDPFDMHQRMATTLDTVVADIRGIQRDARANGFTVRPRWPMIILRSPKGWTGPKVVDGKRTEGTFRSHQVPMGDMSRPGHVKILDTWMRSYRPRELFDAAGRLVPELAALAPKGERRMSANPHANGGLLLHDLRLPDFRAYAVTVPRPGAIAAEATRVQGEFIRDVITRNADNFRVFSPDETNSNRWNAVF